MKRKGNLNYYIENKTFIPLRTKVYARIKIIDTTTLYNIRIPSILRKRNFSPEKFYE